MLLACVIPLFLFVVNHVVCAPEPVVLTVHKQLNNYSPDWKSLDSRPLPAWYDEAKIGIFMHWGVYSVPSFGSEWFWANWDGNTTKYVQYMNKNYPPGFKYQDFGSQFTAEFFEPNRWAELFKKSGAKYVVLTSKHHEGFTLFPSKYTFGWNSVDIGPHRDLVGDLAHAIRSNTDLKFGVYYSLYEWFNPLYQSDKDSNFTKHQFTKHKMLPEMVDLVKRYKPEVWWSDGDWEAPDAYFHSKEFLAWLYNESPVRNSVVVNDRWGMDIPCHHGGYYTCTDRYNPGVLQEHKWENAMTIDKKSWGFRRNAALSEYMTIEELITTLAMTISCGGNLLMNIGPAKDGTISPIFEERLLQIGEWLQSNGEAVYGSRPWIHQNETAVRVWYTFNNDAVYAICLDWPEHGILSLQKARDLFIDGQTVVSMLSAEKLQWSLTEDNKKVNIVFPDKAHVRVQWAWVLKIYH